MPAWQPQGGGSGGSVVFRDTGGGGGGSAPIYHPTASGGGTGVAGGVDPNANPPGNVSINPLDPGGSIKAAGESGGNFIDGLAKGIFGVQLSDGSHAGGVPVLSNIAGAVAATPVVNTLVGTVGDMVGGAGDVLKGAADAVGGALERLPGVPGAAQIADEKFNDPAVQSWLDAKSDPEDPASKTNREKYVVEGQYGPGRDGGTFDKGILGTGFLGSESHMKNVVLREFAKAQAIKDPTFNPGAFQAPGSLADTVTFLLNDTLVVASQAYQTGIARLHDRAGEAAKLASGDYVSTGFLGTGLFGGDAGATSVEQLAAEKMKDGSWTSDQATDFLVTAGQTAHDARLSIALAVASPDVAASFGMAAVAKLGAKGAQLFRTVGIADKAITVAEDGVKAAQAAKLAAKAGGAVGKELRAASKVIRDAQAELKVAQDARASMTAGRLAGTTLSIGEKYAGLSDAETGLRTMTGRIAKYTRTLIDPMHAIDLKLPGKARLVDLMSDATTKVLSDVAGPQHYLANGDHFKSLDTTGTLFDKYSKDLATAATNRAREGLLTMHQVSAVLKGLGGKLAGTKGANMEEVIADAAKGVKERSLNKWLREDYTKHVIQQDWNEAAHADLAKVLEARYGTPAEEWLKALPNMSKEQKSLMKFAAYGGSNSRLIQAVSDSAGHASAAAFDLNRIVLMSKTTLSRIGGESLLSKLKATKSTKAAVSLIRKWQAEYPELKYIAIDEANPGKSVKQMMDYLDKNLDRLPMQVRADELKQMHDSMKGLSASLGDGYQLGFRPKDEFLWGIERANQAGGEYIARRAPWADHVGYGGLGFRPGHDLPLNIAGMPIVGGVATKAVKVADYMAAGARMLGAQVSGQQVHEIARQRFTSEASRGVFAEKGLTSDVAGQWFDRLQEYTKEHQGYSGPRGFGKGDLYNAIDKERLIPKTLLNGSLRIEPEDVLRMVLDAYDGDMRYIGLTQKLSSRAKRVLSLDGRTNFTGQIAEHAWPTLKFRYNPLFQLQEKIEPVVLNVQRGVSFAARPRMTAADRATERLLQRMTDNSIIRQGDVDMFEQSMYAMFGKRMDNLAKTPGGKMSALQGAAASFMDVQGLKRINMVRTFRHGMGKELKAVYNEVEPKLWDQMYEHASAKAGRMLDEDEFAVQVMSENLLGNDIKVTKTFAEGGKDILKADWANAIKPGAWHVPAHFGELKALDLEHIALTMNTRGVDGKRIENLADLRKYIAEDHGRVSEVREYLNRLGADKDYIARVENALTFSWEGFWQEAGKRFGLTTGESMALQDMVGESARLRGMAPTDFLSQVYSPGILDGTEGIIGSLDKPLGILRRNAAGQVTGRGRSVLAGKTGLTNKEDLVRQMSGVFSAHLDPSARRALLMEFKPELKAAVDNGTLKLDLEDLQKMWDKDAEGQLADRILSYMDGKPPTGKLDILKDPARGDAAIRAGADKYLTNHGVTPLGIRHNVHVDEAHYQQVADEYTALPSIDYEKTGRRPMTKQVYAADRDLKPMPAGVDQRTYDAYQQFVHENFDQFAHMTAPKAKGGMGIKVTVAKGEPYTPDAAGRAAMQADLKKGQLRVKGTDSDHPLMTNEQTVMFRAVHDVFGHGAEGFSFGPRGELNAAAAHFKMYGPEARGPLLTETHGQTAYVNYSNELYSPPTERNLPSELSADNPIADFEAAHPYVIPEAQQEIRDAIEAQLHDPDFPAAEKKQLRKDLEKPGTAYVSLGVNRVNGVADIRHMRYDKFVGDGIRALPTSQQHMILQQLHDLMTEMPDLKVHHIDVVDLGGSVMKVDPKDEHVILQYGFGDGVNGVAFGADEREGVILLGDRDYGMDFDQNIEHKLAQNEEFAKRPFKFQQGVDPATGQTTYTRISRESNLGVPHNAGVGPGHVVRHEAGHILDLMLRPRKWGSAAHTRLPEHAEYFDAVQRLSTEEGRVWLSEYGMTDQKEFAADLFSVATDPGLDLTTLKPKLRSMVVDYQYALIHGGYWKPGVIADPALEAMRGKSIRELNATKRGSVYAPQKAGLLPQATIDDFAQKFVGQGKHVESNPDVARAAQMFGQWSQAAVFNGLMKGDKAVHADLLERLGGIPTHEPVPYNLTEGMTQQIATDAMKAKFADAFRLQYFSQDRSMLERSINHPMFGMYPASYMWGKLLPEVGQFIAQRPFGIRTGGALSASMHAQSAIALRREYDPAFDAQLEKLGHSQAMSFAGYLLPTLPWDIGASAPTWMKDVAAQGTRNQQNADTGKPIEDFNVVQPLTDVAKKLDPVVQNLAWAGRAVDELNGPNTPTELRQAAIDAANGGIKASNISPIMSQVLAELKAALSH